ncbi:ABC transporter substrate-binding protein [Streptomyces mexicanus]|uniref:ABC transporter substrate-binding protein n=1 Tax=Streptomyces mexicanus TaxID=178566 RepID=A0A7X1I690_9ACTN|nr:ABC transporter substrate-binding protein [Streptomyces mexicanus]MBC2869547.1 ABC transporter substrate-binding protein [Streptomyces mexicanus]
MNGRRRTRTTLLGALARRAARRRLMGAGAVAACLSLVGGCGVLPGTTGGSGEDTVTVMTWAPDGTRATNKPGMPAMARAYARWVNAHGGIAGHRLKVLTCNDRNDSVEAGKCARRAVEANVVAVVGSYSQYSDAFFPPLESAGIPYIGGYGVTTTEFTRALSYPVNGGQPTLLVGLGRELAADCGPVALVRPDSIAGDELPELLDAGLRAGGHAPADDELAPEDATEYSAQAQRALGQAASAPGRKGCVIPALGERTGIFMDSFRRLREDYPAVRTDTVVGSVDQTVIDAAGGQSGPYEGAYLTGWYPVASDPRWDPMKKVINEEAFGDNRVDPADPGVQTTWIAYTVLRAALEKIGGGEVSADTVRRTLDAGLRVDTGGLTPALRWQQSGPFAGAGFARLVNPQVTLQVVRQGRLVPAGKGEIDVTKTLQDADLE